MSAAVSGATRERILTEALRLFGAQGYAATTVAQIEAAAGLSPGSGALYRHFPSKEALLTAAVQRSIAGSQGLVASLEDPHALAALPLRARLVVLVRAGLRRLEQERDLRRLLVRDLARFPDLLAAVRDDEFRRVYAVVARWFADQAAEGSDQDWTALSAVLVDATVHYWRLGDLFGAHPAGLDEERYVGAIVELAMALLAPRTPPPTAGRTPESTTEEVLE
jgi:AcrR family transcriptional regulator